MHIFLIFSRKHDLTFHANCLEKAICIRCQILFSRKKKTIINLSSAEVLTQHAKH